MSLEFENNGILQQQKILGIFFFKFFEKQILESLLLLRRANCYPIFVMMLYQHLKSAGTMSFVTQLAHLSFSVIFNRDQKFKSSHSQLSIYQKSTETQKSKRPLYVR